MSNDTALKKIPGRRLQVTRPGMHVFSRQDPPGAASLQYDEAGRPFPIPQDVGQNMDLDTGNGSNNASADRTTIAHRRRNEENPQRDAESNALPHMAGPAGRLESREIPSTAWMPPMWPNPHSNTPVGPRDTSTMAPVSSQTTQGDLPPVLFMPLVPVPVGSSLSEAAASVIRAGEAMQAMAQASSAQAFTFAQPNTFAQAATITTAQAPLQATAFDQARGQQASSANANTSAGEQFTYIALTPFHLTPSPAPNPANSSSIDNTAPPTHVQNANPSTFPSGQTFLPSSSVSTSFLGANLTDTQVSSALPAFGLHAANTSGLGLTQDELQNYRRLTDIDRTFRGQPSGDPNRFAYQQPQWAAPPHLQTMYPAPTPNVFLPPTPPRAPPLPFPLDLRENYDAVAMDVDDMVEGTANMMNLLTQVDNRRNVEGPEVVAAREARRAAFQHQLETRNEQNQGPPQPSIFSSAEEEAFFRFLAGPSNETN